MRARHDAGGPLSDAVDPSRRGVRPGSHRALALALTLAFAALAVLVRRSARAEPPDAAAATAAIDAGTTTTPTARPSDHAHPTTPIAPGTVAGDAATRAATRADAATSTL